MIFFRPLLRAIRGPAPAPLNQDAATASPAFRTMHELNPHALIAPEERHVAMIEDVSDPDGRMYRMEYQSTPDGMHALAFCRFNPWGAVNGGVGLATGHVDSDGLLCMGSGHAYSRDPARSSHDLTTVIQRSRYWCTAFSVLKETGQFPQP